MPTLDAFQVQRRQGSRRIPLQLSLVASALGSFAPRWHGWQLYLWPLRLCCRLLGRQTGAGYSCAGMRTRCLALLTLPAASCFSTQALLRVCSGSTGQGNAVLYKILHEALCFCLLPHGKELGCNFY